MEPTTAVQPQVDPEDTSAVNLLDEVLIQLLALVGRYQTAEVGYYRRMREVGDAQRAMSRKVKRCSEENDRLSTALDTAISALDQAGLHEEAERAREVRHGATSEAAR